MTALAGDGLSLAPFRALRPRADGSELALLLCPPYDVIDDAERTRLLAADPDNAVAVVLPRGAHEAAGAGDDQYVSAARRLDGWVASGHLAVDDEAALYVYEMRSADGSATRGLLGAVELRDPADGVILPHENTMAGPVSDRLALMSATQANLEPIYLVYDGGGAASSAVSGIADGAEIAETSTMDGVTHRLWAISDGATLAAVAADLATRRALIADGHHRYATYRELQRLKNRQVGPGPWDRGLTLLVDSSTYGPQVHAIHRVLVGVALDTAVRQAGAATKIVEFADAAAALAELDRAATFAVVLTDGQRSFVVTDPERHLAARAQRSGEPAVLATLDVTVLHRVLVEDVWGLADTVETVGYAHSVQEAVSAARATGGTAVLLRPTAVSDVAAVAAAGARMPRKSTLFTPKPASGLVMRRFADER
jgi:uncharacterized protein (DUF1015 family)